MANWAYLTSSPEQSRQRRRLVQGTYDAARDGNESVNIWANADYYDADSANSKLVRHKLIARSRYEIGNNGYANGIAQTYATDVVGTGPSLRMQTVSAAFNRLVETNWYYWSKAIRFRQKLWCLAHAKHSDGEGMGRIVRNPKVRHEIKLDLVPFEAEQCQTPYVPFLERGYIDGIKFDQFGNPEWYDILREHPGSTSRFEIDLVPERVPAEFVIHWFKNTRPGQHRGIPECASTLNLGATARRFREATVAAAETAADFALMLKTQQQPDTADPVSPFDTVDIQKRMAMFLPEGWDPMQLKAEHPTATYESFNKQLINEQSRPKSMPFIKAACDASGSNYAAGRLDHQGYYSALDVDREDANDLVLDPLFRQWFYAAVRRFGWLGGNPEAIGEPMMAHVWDWPQHAVIDLATEATATETKLRSGQTYPSEVYSRSGRDFEDDIEKMAADYGLDVEEMRELLRNAVFNAQNQQASMESADAQQKQAEKAAEPAAPARPADPVEAILRSRGTLNGATNGHH